MQYKKSQHTILCDKNTKRESNKCDKETAASSDISVSVTRRQWRVGFVETERQC
jgi:hypothetical protein